MAKSNINEHTTEKRMQNPIHKKGGYKPAELQIYARHRADEQLTNISNVLIDYCEDKVETVEEHDEHREPIEMSERREFLVRLSWGGDGDGFKIITDVWGEPVSGIYFWEDWGVYEEVPLSNDELRMVYNYYNIDNFSE